LIVGSCSSKRLAKSRIHYCLCSDLSFDHRSHSMRYFIEGSSLLSYPRTGSPSFAIPHSMRYFIEGCSLLSYPRTGSPSFAIPHSMRYFIEGCSLLSYPRTGSPSFAILILKHSLSTRLKWPSTETAKPNRCLLGRKPPSAG
jgi:hypothetical protein